MPHNVEPYAHVTFKKKLDLRGASRPPSILIRRRPSNAGRETPRTPALSDLGSGAISWNRYPGRDRYPLGRETVTPGRARLTTQPKLSGAQRGGFFPQAGKFAPVGVRTPHLWSAAGCFAPTGLTTLGSSVNHSIYISIRCRNNTRRQNNLVMNWQVYKRQLIHSFNQEQNPATCEKKERYIMLLRHR